MSRPPKTAESSNCGPASASARSPHHPLPAKPQSVSSNIETAPAPAASYTRSISHPVTTPAPPPPPHSSSPAPTISPDPCCPPPPPKYPCCSSNPAPAPTGCSQTRSCFHQETTPDRRHHNHPQ